MYQPLDLIFATPSAVRILRALEPLAQPVSAREAARRAGLSHAARSVLDQLHRTGILARTETPAQHLYRFNRDHVLAGAIEGLFRVERESEALLIGKLREVLAPLPIVSAAIFGSQARGSARAGSDLDLLVLTQSDESVDRAYAAFVESWESARARFGVPVSPIVFSVRAARREWRNGSEFLRGAVRDGRLVVGIPMDDALA